MCTFAVEKSMVVFSVMLVITTIAHPNTNNIILSTIR